MVITILITNCIILGISIILLALSQNSLRKQVYQLENELEDAQRDIVHIRMGHMPMEYQYIKKIVEVNNEKC